MLIPLKECAFITGKAYMPSGMKTLIRTQAMKGEYLDIFLDDNVIHVLLQNGGHWVVPRDGWTGGSVDAEKLEKYLSGELPHPFERTVPQPVERPAKRNGK